MNRIVALAAALGSVFGSGLALGQISFTAPATYAAVANPDGVALLDLGGDGRPDLAVTADAPDRIDVRTNSGGGVFGGASSVFVANGSGPHSLVAANIDGDSDMDLVVSLHNANQIQVLVNTGGTLSAGATFDVGGNDPRNLAAGDLDGNGTVDVVTSNRSSGDISVLLNTGGAFAAPDVYPISTDVRGVALAYVDSDLLLDIVVSSHDTREVRVLFNIPATPGVFTSGPSLSVGAQLRPDGVDVRDLDGDGDADIVAATSGNGLNFATVFLNQGSGTFGGAMNFPAGGVNPGAVVAVDFDRDGRRDLALANQDSGNVSVLRNLGGGSFGSAMLLAVGTNPQALATADIDFNGAADLVCANQDSGTVTVYRNASVPFADGFESNGTSHWSVVVP